ncbi:hypothetical protein BD289DRAFT_50307 [Coniella lustricola]|uniref:Secreted protein n=1 Tax=Coniella lustricola TaxID=2025994 RepID=A0A2T3A1E1_9PEZI|nr:hypothetical protein BD289DRAFT_50307 [Coniella lustricola]
MITTHPPTHYCSSTAAGMACLCLAQAATAGAVLQAHVRCAFSASLCTGSRVGTHALPHPGGQAQRLHLVGAFYLLPFFPPYTRLGDGRCLYCVKISHTASCSLSWDLFLSGKDKNVANTFARPENCCCFLLCLLFAFVLLFSKQSQSHCV